MLPKLRETRNQDLLDATFRETGRLYSNLIIYRKVTTSQIIMGKHIPKGTMIGASPVVTARDPAVFSEPNKFRPERWMKDDKLDEAFLKKAVRSGGFVQFGKGLHACLGERMGRMIVLDLLWNVILGNDEEPGFDMEIISGVRDGVGVDNVGVEPAWVEENFGTPFEKGEPVMVKFRKRMS